MVFTFNAHITFEKYPGMSYSWDCISAHIFAGKRPHTISEISALSFGCRNSQLYVTSNRCVIFDKPRRFWVYFSSKTGAAGQADIEIRNVSTYHYISSLDLCF